MAGKENNELIIAAEPNRIAGIFAEAYNQIQDQLQEGNLSSEEADQAKQTIISDAGKSLGMYAAAAHLLSSFSKHS